MSDDSNIIDLARRGPAVLRRAASAGADVSQLGRPLTALSSKRRVILAAAGFDVPSSVACTYLGQVLSNL